MPLAGNVSYWVKTTGLGKKVRLASRGKKVVEAKNLSTGATHTESEFKQDQRRASRKFTPGKTRF